MATPGASEVTPSPSSTPTAASPSASAGHGGLHLARHGSGYGLALLALCWAHVFFLGSLLAYPDLVLTYPFPGGDGWDWVNNGLHLAGEDVRSTQRPPLLPWVLSVLDRSLDSMHFFPVVHQLAVQGGVFLLFLVIRRRTLPPAAFAASLTLLFGAAYQLQGFAVMAEHLAGLLLFGAAVMWMRAVDTPSREPGWRAGRSFAAGLLGGLSAVTQQAALLLPLAIAVAALLARPVSTDGRRGWGWLRGPLVVGIFPFLAIPGLWFLWKRWTYGTFTGIATRHWELLDPHLDAVGFYTEAVVRYFGIPALLIAALGTWQMVKRRTPGDVFVLALLGTLAVFFVFLYDWPAERFVVYGYLLVGIPLAEGFGRLRGFHRALPWAAMVVAVLWIAVPGMPGGLEPGVEQSPYLQALHTRAERLPLHREAPEIPQPSHYAAADSVVFLHAEERKGAERYRTQYRLGGALRKRVKWVPAALYPDNWPGWRDLRWRAAFDEYEVFGVRLPGFERSHLVAAARGSEVAVRLHRIVGTEPEAADAAMPSEEDSRVHELPRRPLEEILPAGWEGPGGALDIAHRLDDLTGRDPRFLAVLADGGVHPWLQLLPFVVHTTSLFVLEGDAATAARAQIEEQVEAQKAPEVGRIETKEGEALIVRRAEVAGWRTLVVESLYPARTPEAEFPSPRGRK